MKNVLLSFLIPFLATRTAQGAPFNFVQDFPGLEQSFGRALSMNGDLNGDGVPDLVIGSSEEVKFNPHINKSGQLAYDTIGKVFVYSGATGQLLYEFSGKTNDKFGVSVESGCDIDGDGYADILIGAVEGILLGSSYVRIISGRTGQDLYSVTESNSRVFGQTIACAGDVNGDGKGDFLVGAPDEFDSFVKLYSGANGASLGVFTQGDRDFGASLAGGKDFDGDGVPDFIIGDPEYKVSSADINDPLCQSILVPFDAQLGRAIVYSGKPGFSELFEIIGSVDCDTKRGDYLGREVNFAGDINGDGFQDLMVISETGESVFGNLGEGNLRILSGKDFQILNTISIDASWYYYNFKHFAVPRFHLLSEETLTLLAAARRKVTGVIEHVVKEHLLFGVFCEGSDFPIDVS